MSNTDVAAQVFQIIANAMVEIMPLIGGLAAVAYVLGLLISFLTDN